MNSSIVNQQMKVPTTNQVLQLLLSKGFKQTASNLRLSKFEHAANADFTVTISNQPMQGDQWSTIHVYARVLNGPVLPYSQLCELTSPMTKTTIKKVINALTSTVQYPVC